MVVAAPGRLLSTYRVGGGRFVVPDFASKTILGRFGNYLLPLGEYDPEEPARPILESVAEGTTVTTALTIPAPAGVAVGDNVLLVCAYSGSGTGFGTPSGIPKIVDVARGTGGRLQMFWSNIDDAADIVASYGLTASSTGNHMGWALRISGASYASPTTATSSNSSAVSPQTSSASVAAWDNSLILRAVTGSRSTSPMTWTNPDGTETVEYAEVGAGPVTSGLIVQEKVPFPPDIRPAGTGPAKSWTPVVAAAYASATVTIGPAVNPPQTFAGLTAGGSATSGNLTVTLRTDSLVSEIGTPTTATTFTTNSNVTISKVTAAAAGDLLLAFTSYRTDASGYSPPAGWTLVLAQPLLSNVGTLQVWSKIAGPDEPTSYTWSNSTTSKTQAGMMMAFRGVTGIDATAGNQQVGTYDAMTSPAATPAKQWTRVVRVNTTHLDQILTPTHTWPGGWTEKVDFGISGNAGTAMTAATAVQSASGTTGTVNVVGSSNFIARWAGVTVALAGD